ncbi:MAG: hypothetical protein ACODAB_07425, partial [Gemmatimonadota bacterium]
MDDMLIQARRRAVLGFVPAVATCALLVALAAAGRPASPDVKSAAPCAEAPDPAPDLSHSRDLFCIELTPPPRFRGAAGSVELRRIAGPFAVNPTPDGRLRYAAVVHTEGLPAADSLGSYDGYGVWIAGPTMVPMRRLGPVEPGSKRRLGDIDLNR